MKGWLELSGHISGLKNVTLINWFEPQTVLIHAHQVQSAISHGQYVSSDAKIQQGLPQPRTHREETTGPYFSS